MDGNLNCVFVPSLCCKEAVRGVLPHMRKGDGDRPHTGKPEALTTPSIPMASFCGADSSGSVMLPVPGIRTYLANNPTPLGSLTQIPTPLP